MALRLGGFRAVRMMKGMAPEKRGLAVVLEREASKQASKPAADNSLDSISGLRIGGPYVQNLLLLLDSKFWPAVLPLSKGGATMTSKGKLCDGLAEHNEVWCTCRGNLGVVSFLVRSGSQTGRRASLYYTHKNQGSIKDFKFSFALPPLYLWCLQGLSLVGWWPLRI